LAFEGLRLIFKRGWGCAKLGAQRAIAEGGCAPVHRAGDALAGKCPKTGEITEGGSVVTRFGENGGGEGMFAGAFKGCGDAQDLRLGKPWRGDDLRHARAA